MPLTICEVIVADDDFVIGLDFEVAGVEQVDLKALLLR